MKFSIRDWRSWAYSSLALSALSVTIYLFFKTQFDSLFHVTFGDEYDGAIAAVLVSHWYKVFTLLHFWNETGYFYPIRDTLGYNDGYFLNGLLALPFRLAHYNVFEGTDFSYVLIKIIGFASMVCLSNLILGTLSLGSIFGASLFVMMISSSNQGFHGQLFTVALSPLVFLCILKTIRGVDRPGRTFLGWGIATIAILAIWLITSFYMAWFFLLFCLSLLTVLLMLHARALWSMVTLAWINKRGQLGTLLVIGIASLVPFLLVYGPKLRETNGHGYQEMLALSPHVQDIFNIGYGSILWGPLFSAVSAALPRLFREGEFKVGFTPDVVLCVLALLALAIWSQRFRLTPTERTILFGTALLLVLPISYHNKSLWYFVFKLVPGATGVRVTSREWIFLAFPTALLLSGFVHRLWLDRRTMAVALVVSVLLVTSQVNTKTQVGLDVAAQMKLVQAVPPTPAGCTSFFMVDRITQERSKDLIYALYHDNVCAMVIADFINLPTINGIASFNPPNWDFSAASPETYLERVQIYARTHGITQLCGYDADASTWIIDPFAGQ